MSTWYSLSFQDANSPIMENMIFFHDTAMTIIMIITSMVIYLMMNIFLNKFINRFKTQAHNLEIIWTITPMIFLFIMAIPSLKILYLTDNNSMYNWMITVKIIGHQWYWSYELPEFFLDYDSYMITDFEMNNFRLLDVDNRLILPYLVPIRLLVTSVDVIHSWTIQSLGMKIDAIPGRINQTQFIAIRPGIFYGQCSEICGMNHSFMPIVMEITHIKFMKNIYKIYN